MKYYCPECSGPLTMDREHGKYNCLRCYALHRKWRFDRDEILDKPNG